MVYRLDSRPPAEVFANGFTTRGTNTELLLHLVGDTSRNHTDGLISTTSNMHSVVQIAADMMPFDDNVLWMYVITPNNNFYNVNDSLLNAAVNHNLTESISNQSLNFFTRLSWQFEYASRVNIDASQIASARPVRWNNGSIELVNEVSINHSFIQTPPSVNPGFLVPTRTVDDLLFGYFGDYDDDPVGIFFAPDGCGNIFEKKSTCKSVAYSVFKESVINELNSKLFVFFTNV